VRRCLLARAPLRFARPAIRGVMEMKERGAGRDLAPFALSGTPPLVPSWRDDCPPRSGQTAALSSVCGRWPDPVHPRSL
jgi:hypothetical protein